MFVTIWMADNNRTCVAQTERAGLFPTCLITKLMRPTHYLTASQSGRWVCLGDQTTETHPATASSSVRRLSQLQRRQCITRSTLPKSVFCLSTVRRVRRDSEGDMHRRRHARRSSPSKQPSPAFHQSWQQSSRILPVGEACLTRTIRCIQRVSLPCVLTKRLICISHINQIVLPTTGPHGGIGQYSSPTTSVYIRKSCTTQRSI